MSIEETLHRGLLVFHLLLNCPVDRIVSVAVVQARVIKLVLVLCWQDVAVVVRLTVMSGCIVHLWNMS